LKKLRKDYIWEMLATILFRIFCNPLSCLKILKIKIHKTIILLFVLCGCETWSLTPGEECRLRMFQSRVIRRIFGPKREEVAGGLENTA
jgi:hypothetical protein